MHSKAAGARNGWGRTRKCRTLPRAPAATWLPNQERARGGGIHQKSFTRRPDHSVWLNCAVSENSGRMIGPDGKTILTRFKGLTHQSWHPAGKYVIFEHEGLAGFDPNTQREWPILKTKDGIEMHTTWNSYDPNWAACSWRTRFAGEIMRVSMREDHSVARLCGSCPLNPNTTAYNNDEFA